MSYVAFFDGGNRSDRGASACVIYEGGLEIVCAADFYGEIGLTNNIVEWRALILAFEQALHKNILELIVYGDSELVVRQFNGQYKVRKPHLVPYYDRAHELAERFDRVEVREAPEGATGRRRDNNERADELCNKAMNTRTSYRRDEVDLDFASN